jgi:hypothetical protein
MLRAAVFATLGLGLLALAYGYVRLFRHAFVDTELVISPFQIITSGKEGSDRLGQQLALMLQSRLRRLQTEFDEAQRGLQSVAWLPNRGASDGKEIATAVPIVPGFIVATSRVDLPTAVLSPSKLDVVVGGVQVGGVWPWLDRLFVQNRTLDLFVSYEDKGALITGALPSGEFLEISASTGASDITDRVAHSLLRRRLSEKTEQLRALDDESFLKLVHCIVDLNALNERVRSGGVIKGNLVELFGDMRRVADQAPEWYQVNYLAASLADAIANEDAALELYRRSKQFATSDKTAGGKAAKERDELVERASTRIEWLSHTTKEDASAALDRIREHARYATQALNALFHRDQEPPTVELEPSTFMNAFLDKGQYHAPPPVQYMPDITYHEVAHGYLPKWEFRGQTGGLFESYADVLAITIRPGQKQQTAAAIDWTLARGAIGWLTGGDIEGSKAQGGLRSLSKPGEAYDDPVLGKDPQISHASQLTNDLDLHYITGIPSKAFYETAMKLGPDRALEIWLAGLHALAAKKAPSFVDAASATVKAAGSSEKDAVREAWKAVGVAPLV